MEKISLKELALPLIKSIDSFNYLLKSHHRRTAIISYYLGKKLGLSEKDMIDLVIAASLHDIGALSVQERDMLIKEDVENPEPHCVMGFKMLANFDVFDNVAMIIRHHHIKFHDIKNYDYEIPFQSHIVHLADRVDISIDPSKFVLNQKNDVTEHILSKAEIVFHPEVVNAFAEVSKADIFWIEINNMTMKQLFNKINFSLFHDISVKQMIEFALVVSRIIDFRSKFTASHSYTVGKIAQKIGELLGYDKDKCIKLLVSGYFHDIGKIGIDTNFIEKPTSLTQEEFNQVKLHTYYTGQILNELSGSEWFKEIIDWALHHHEKIDGSGYPFALKKDEISEGTIIIAFSDIISALMEERPYREGLNIENTFAIIESKMAEKLGTEMFSKIMVYKDEINSIVHNCHKESIEAYTRKCC